MNKPILIERCADNGAFSHWVLIQEETGDFLWSEAPDEETRQIESLLKEYNMGLKTNINLWEISYKENQIQFSTIFNSGFINDINMVKEYFKKLNPTVDKMNIKKV